MDYMKVVSGHEAREQIKIGIDILANAVKSTLGPSGRTVFIQQLSSGPIATQDGVSVARSIKLAHPLQDMGAQAIKDVANNANKISGDGTTTATVIAQAIFENLYSLEKGVNVSEVKKGMDLALKVIKKKLLNQSITFSNDNKGKEYMRKVASISANNDNEIADLILEAMEIVGDSGAIKIDLGRSHKSEVKSIDGLSYASGMISRYFAKDKSNLTTKFKEPLILLTDFKIENGNVLEEIGMYCHENQKPLFVISDDVSDDFLARMLRNNDSGMLSSCFVKAPGFGSQREDILEDLAVITGGIAITKSKHQSISVLKELKPLDVLGSAEEVVIRKNEFTILSGSGDKQKIEARKKLIKSQYNLEEDGYMKDKLNERAAKLTNGVAIIYAGAESEIDAKEKRDRIEDAVNAVKSSVEMGVLPGGGTALYKIALNDSSSFPSNKIDQMVGYDAVINACKIPFEVILKNAFIEKNEIEKEIITSDNFFFGYNVKEKKFQNLQESGVLDPTKVVLTALKNAVSISGTLMTTSFAIHSAPQTVETKIIN